MNSLPPLSSRCRSAVECADGPHPLTPLPEGEENKTQSALPLFSPLPPGQGPDFGELSRAGARAAREQRRNKNWRINRLVFDSLFATAAVLSNLAGCQSVDRPLSLPVSHSVRSDQLLVLSDFKLSKDHELIRELSHLREQVAAQLELPLKRETVVVYLFNNEADYRRYMSSRFPQLPPRSAYFVASSTELAVYTHWGDNVREDLRHEFTHGLLHSAIKRVPLWLDEGLAEYFEVAGPRPGGMNHDYPQRLAARLSAGWHPDLTRLEHLDEFVQMKRADYQESWAWIHFLLNTDPHVKGVLLDYLKDLRTNPQAELISHRLRKALPDFDDRFVAYVSHLGPPQQTVGSL
jgi:hypothetical protein